MKNLFHMKILLKKYSCRSMSYMNSRNYLIIGGLGSIGQALINHFEDRNFIVIDKFPNTNSNVNFFQCDVSKKDQLEKIIPKLPDNLTVLYLAGNQPFSNDIEKINQSIDDNILAICNTVLILNRKIKNKKNNVNVKKLITKKL